MTNATPAPDLVIFDITGTIITNTQAVADAFFAALADSGFSVAAEDLLPWRGAPKRLAIRSLLQKHSPRTPSAEQVETIYARFHQEVCERFESEGLQLIPGVEQALAWLRGQGLRLAFNTGFDRDIADLILRALKWERGVVDAVVCGDEVAQGRPAPYMIFHVMERTGVLDVRRVAVVGDTTLDLQAGWHAGVGQIIGVLSGAHGRDRLSKAPHTSILASVADLPELWGRVK